VPARRTDIPAFPFAHGCAYSDDAYGREIVQPLAVTCLDI
jgi:hypothetical protein